MYALHPDPLITNSRNSLTAKVKEINEFHTEQFVKSLVGLFVSDLENGQYSAFYYREYGLTGYCIDNQLRLKFRDGEGDKVIENKHRIALAECMGQVFLWHCSRIFQKKRVAIMKGYKKANDRLKRALDGILEVVSFCISRTNDYQMA